MIKRKDLADIGDKDWDTRRDEFMQCLDCGEEFGGTQGDYFMMPMNEAFYCPECESGDIVLARRVSKIEIIKQ